MKDTSELIQKIAGIRDPERLQAFFEEILTENERKDLTLRWRLMKMLKAGVPQRKIAAELGVSLCKITRGSKIIKNPESITNQLIKSK